MNPGSVTSTNMQIVKKKAEDPKVSSGISLNCHGPSSHCYNVFRKPGEYNINVNFGAGAVQASPSLPNNDVFSVIPRITYLSPEMRVQAAQMNLGGGTASSAYPQEGDNVATAGDKEYKKEEVMKKAL